MSQQDLVVALQAQGKSAIEMHHHFIQAFGGLTITDSTVSRTLSKMSQSPKDDEARDFCRRPPNELIDTRIAQVLDDDAGVSTREIAYKTGIPSSTIWYALATRIAHTWRKCRIIPHTLNDQ
jgi:hypothetical protein